jgi:hypothetical protein
MPFRLSVFLLAVALLCCPFLEGCSGSASSSSANAGPRNPVFAAGATDDISNDECSSRLQDICGGLLEYYAINRIFPVRLEDMQSIGDPGLSLKFTCPETGLPYVYVPGGLRRPGAGMSIIVHDARANKKEVRNCILMSVAANGQAPTLRVEPIPEAVFLTYR